MTEKTSPCSKIQTKKNSSEINKNNAKLRQNNLFLQALISLLVLVSTPKPSSTAWWQTFQIFKLYMNNTILPAIAHVMIQNQKEKLGPGTTTVHKLNSKFIYISSSPGFDSAEPHAPSHVPALTIFSFKCEPLFF